MRVDADRGWRQSCGIEGGLARECRRRITATQISPRVSDGIGEPTESCGLPCFLVALCFFAHRRSTMRKVRT